MRVRVASPFWGIKSPSFKEYAGRADSPVVSASTLEERASAPAQGPAIAADDEGLVEQSRARVARALGDREILPTVATATAFVATAVALLVWLPATGPDASLGVIVALVACYALAARVQFEVAFAYRSPDAARLRANAVSGAAQRGADARCPRLHPEHGPGAPQGAKWHVGRAGLHFVSAWHSVGPVLVLAAVGSPSPTLGHLPLMALALAAQFAFDFASSAGTWLRRPRDRRRESSPAPSARPGSSTWR